MGFFLFLFVRVFFLLYFQCDFNGFFFLSFLILAWDFMSQSHSIVNGQHKGSTQRNLCNRACGGYQWWMPAWIWSSFYRIFMKGELDGSFLMDRKLSLLSLMFCRTTKACHSSGQFLLWFWVLDQWTLSLATSVVQRVCSASGPKRIKSFRFCL